MHLTKPQLKCTPLSFWTGKELRARVETLPPGPTWLCKPMEPEGATKNAVHVFYHQLLDCIQALLSHPLLAPNISFTPW